MHLCENYHIVPLKLIRYHHKSVGVNLRDKKKGSKCKFCCEQGSIPGAEEKHVVHNLHLCFLVELFRGPVEDSWQAEQEVQFSPLHSHQTEKL